MKKFKKLMTQRVEIPPKVKKIIGKTIIGFILFVAFLRLLAN